MRKWCPQSPTSASAIGQHAKTRHAANGGTASPSLTHRVLVRELQALRDMVLHRRVCAGTAAQCTVNGPNPRHALHSNSAGHSRAESKQTLHVDVRKGTGARHAPRGAGFSNGEVIMSGQNFGAHWPAAAAAWPPLHDRFYWDELDWSLVEVGATCGVDGLHGLWRVHCPSCRVNRQIQDVF